MKHSLAYILSGSRRKHIRSLQDKISTSAYQQAMIEVIPYAGKLLESNFWAAGILPRVSESITPLQLIAKAVRDISWVYFLVGICLMSQSLNFKEI
jgi:hypothetical protein